MPVSLVVIELGVGHIIRDEFGAVEALIWYDAFPRELFRVSALPLRELLACYTEVRIVGHMDRRTWGSFYQLKPMDRLG